MLQLINDGWYFAKLPSGSTVRDTAEAAFHPVDVPHDWLIWEGTDLYETADAWYKRTIELPEDHDPVVLIRFDGVYMDCDVILNGELICTHPYGYTAFIVPLTGKLRPGKNELGVHIRHKSPNSRWYSGSGIYRDVYIITLPEDHMVPDGLYVREKEDNGEWTLHVSAELSGEGAQRFFCRLADREGSEVSCAEGTVSGRTAGAVLAVPEAKTWSPQDPYLYRMEITYGKQTEVRNVGLRNIHADPDRGLILNGQKIRLKGVCLHHDLGCLGAEFHEKAARRQLLLMKEMGANAVRTSHNPPATGFLDLCDELGLLVIDEAFDMWEKPKTEYDYARFFPGWYQRDVASWVRRDRCHPSVIMWSVGNEIYDMHAGPRGAEITRELAAEVRRHDPQRHAFVTFGCNYMPWEGGKKCAEFVDAVGYNYGESLYADHHAAHPSWILYGSETGSVLSSRGIYHFPADQDIMSDADRQCSALGNSNTSWGAESPKKILLEDLENPFSMGQFIWSGTDYIGEPTPYHTRSCYFGQADTAGFPKDSYYLIQSYWTDRKMIHIGVSWDWNDGQIIDVPVMSNCRDVELILNGKKLGLKSNNLKQHDRFPVSWRVPFAAGELVARGYDEKGQCICEDRRLTPDEPECLCLSCETPYLLSDGQDMAFVTVWAMDRLGLPVENARNRISATVTGGGRLLGTDNGDSADTDSYKSGCRRMFSGKLLLVIASDGTDRDVTVRAEGNGCRAAEITIPVVYAPVKQGVSCLQRCSAMPGPERIHARKISLQALGATELTPDNPECAFHCRICPDEADGTEIEWQVCNAAGIESPWVTLKVKNNLITVRAYGDGEYYLRALCMEDGECAFISQMEFSAAGFGNPALDAYGYISAGLHDLQSGEIGSGNEKGVAFARDSESMIGFSRVDFGKTGSDTLTADIFSLTDDPCELDLLTKESDGSERLISRLLYHKKSIWNVYQPQTWVLPERLSGIRSLCFSMKDKAHMKGFFFEKQSGAWLPHTAGSADSIYGDSFRKEGTSVKGIGNNVTLVWNDLRFDEAGTVWLEIDGNTPLPVNTIHIRVRNSSGQECTGTAEFSCGGGTVQRFPVQVPEGSCTATFIFLPGSSFDFNGFCFCRREKLDIKKDMG